LPVRRYVHKQASLVSHSQNEACMVIPNLNSDSVLQTAALAKALTESGFPTSAATLATKRSRGGGPPFRRWGRVPVYTWGDALKWARDRLGEPRCSTSEEDVAYTAQPASPSTAIITVPPVQHIEQLSSPIDGGAR
jgi:hypothetical protein